MLKHYSCLALLLFSLFSTQNFAQHHCATDDFLQERLENDKKFAEWYAQQIKQEKLSTESRSLLNCTASNSVIIPVAVHYNTPITCADPACLLSQAEAQIAKMNEDFAASNADLTYYTNTLNSACPTAYPLSYAPVAGEGSCIQFCLANQNHPACSNLTDGDPAITVGEYTWQTLSAPWDGYLNVYVSNAATAGLAPGVAGIAFLPGQANGDGVFVRHDVFGAPGASCSSGGTMNTLAFFDNGRVAVHEIGHYLGLPHVFSNSGCTDNDANPPGPIAINDTPQQDNNSGACPTIATCTDVPEDCPATPTSFYSYMDYSNDDCMVMFTEDQSAVINYWGTTIEFKSDVSYCGGTTGAYACITAPTCSDNIKNQGEEAVDCGGPCPDCPSTCGNSFYDPDGLCAQYSNNTFELITLCPDNPTEILSITFNSFDIEEKNGGGCWDWLKVYAGSSTSDPQIGGEFCGTTAADAPGAGILMAANPGDCFTFEFFTDGSVTQQGWDANINCEFILPVELLDFEASAVHNDIHLKWETASEINNEGFDILRKDGEKGVFEKIDFVKGVGSSNTLSSYAYVDRAVYQDLRYYYKLDQKDFDGHTEESSVVSAMVSGNSLAYVLHPNPVDGDIFELRFLNDHEETYSLEMFDLQGRSVLIQDVFTQSKNQINVSQIPSGVYVVKILQGNKILNVERLFRM